jgi:hypothetical protein
MYVGSNPIEDRFGFQTRGIFRCSHPAERILILVTIAAAIIVWIGFYEIWGQQFVFIYHLSDGTPREGETPHALFFALAFSVITAMIVIAAIIIVRMIMRGQIYSYTADSNMFSYYSAKARVRKTDICYNDVVSMSFDKRVIFGFIDRGYTVTIETKSLGKFELEYLHNKSAVSHDPENTPFHIIAERTNLQNLKRDPGGR